MDSTFVKLLKRVEKATKKAEKAYVAFDEAAQEVKALARDIVEEVKGKYDKKDKD